MFLSPTFILKYRPESPGHVQEHQRVLSGKEMLSTHLLPVTQHQADLCGSPKLELDGVSERKRARMGGNTMSVPCVGAILLACVLALDRTPM